MTAFGSLARFLLPLLLVVFDIVSSANKKARNRYLDIQDFDPVLVTKCDTLCLHLISSKKDQCHLKCLTQKKVKPGLCPESFVGLSEFAQACLHVCDEDGQCPGIEKCCSHSCGVTCQPAHHLELHNPPLPPIPKNISVHQLRGNNNVQISWKYPDISSLNRSILFLIEEKSHFGKSFSSESLGPWQPLYEARENSTILNGLLVPARWYVFRVSAINAEGTQGYSLPSKPWTLSKAPNKPGQPRRLSVSHAREANGTVSAELRWTKPRSPIPVTRYKVFWSRRLPGTQTRNATDSILVHQRTVTQGKQHLQLQNLVKKELYYIQVQAIAVYGKRKLKSNKAEIFFNTTLSNE